MKYRYMDEDGFIVCDDDGFMVVVDSLDNAKLLCDLLNRYDKRIIFQDKVIEKYNRKCGRLKVAVEESYDECERLGMENGILRKIIKEIK